MSNKKRIAITGASGKLAGLVEWLEKAGYKLFLIDKKDPVTDAHPAMIADLEDFGATLDALSSVGEDVYSRPEAAAFDAVVHLASIPHPRMIPILTSSEIICWPPSTCLRHPGGWE
jgi:nucleoside-diphosphate-sugar epimerase